MSTNQAGEPVEEEPIFDVSPAMCGEVLLLLIDRLDLTLWRTNATKHGNTELQLRNKT